MIPVWFMCIVLSGCFPCKVTIDSNLCDTLGMGEACSLCTNVEVLYHYILMGFMVMFNYGYLVVKNDDTKNGLLVYLACLA
jgi:hypothetical protein